MVTLVYIETHRIHRKSLVLSRFFIQYSYPITPLQIATILPISTEGFETDASFHVSKTPLNKDRSKKMKAYCLHFGGCYYQGALYIEKEIRPLVNVHYHVKNLFQANLLP